MHPGLGAGVQCWPGVSQMLLDFSLLVLCGCSLRWAVHAGREVVLQQHQGNKMWPCASVLWHCVVRVLFYECSQFIGMCRGTCKQYF